MKSRLLNLSVCCLLSIILLFSCNEKTVPIPDHVIPKDSMASIITDVQLLEAMKMKANINDSFLIDSILFQYALIFKKHNISQEQFEQSFEFYRSHPALLEEIYEMTINEISAMQAILGAYNTALADSIKREREMPAALRLAREALRWKEEQRKEAEAQKLKANKKIQKDQPDSIQQTPGGTKEEKSEGGN